MVNQTKEQSVSLRFGLEELLEHYPQAAVEEGYGIAVVWVPLPTGGATPKYKDSFPYEALLEISGTFISTLQKQGYRLQPTSEDWGDFTYYYFTVSGGGLSDDLSGLVSEVRLHNDANNPNSFVDIRPKPQFLTPYRYDTLGGSSGITLVGNSYSDVTHVYQILEQVVSGMGWEGLVNAVRTREQGHGHFSAPPQTTAIQKTF